MQLAREIASFCDEIGTDPLLVQGAGGNISWKADDTLWIKASGQWIAEANKKNIFVPVDLKQLKKNLSNKIFSINPRVLNKTALRPSIETALHALLPQKIVVHLHPVEILARLIRKTGKSEIQYMLKDNSGWIFINYHKPGEELARAVAKGLEEVPKARLVFLENHGIVVSGNTICEIRTILDQLISNLSCEIKFFATKVRKINSNPNLTVKGYKLCKDKEVHSLVTNKNLYNFLKDSWAICPDQVVFLGAEPFLISKPSNEFIARDETEAVFIFVRNIGIFESNLVTPAQRLQLRLYYELAIRQKNSTPILSLSKQQVNDLLNWEAEHYRKKLNN